MSSSSSAAPVPAISPAAAAAVAPKASAKPLLLVDGVDPFQPKEFLDNPPKPPHWTSSWPLYSATLASDYFIEHAAQQYLVWGAAIAGWSKYASLVVRSRAAEAYSKTADAAQRSKLLARVGMGPIAMRVPEREINYLFSQRRVMSYLPVVVFGGVWALNLFRRGHEEDYWGAQKRTLARDALNAGKTPQQTIDLLREFMEERRTGVKSALVPAFQAEMAQRKAQEAAAAAAGKK